MEAVGRRISAVALMLLALSCARPRSMEYFVRTGTVTDSTYVFSLDLYDSLSAFDVWFYTAFDSPVRDTLNGSFRIDVIWTDPDADTFSETVYMPYGGPGGNKVLYRSGIIPVTVGEWTLEARLHGVHDGLRGLGVICEHKDGTR